MSGVRHRRQVEGSNPSANDNDDNQKTPKMRSTPAKTPEKEVEMEE